MKPVLYPLFSIPLFKNKIYADYSKIINAVGAIEYESSDSREDGPGFLSVSKSVLDSPELLFLKEEIQYNIELYINELHVSDSISFNIVRSWVVKHAQGDYGALHSHKNSLFSGIFYFNVNKDSGELTFRSNHPTIFENTLMPNITNFNIVNSPEWNVVPENGDILIFPSHLKHKIGENKSDITRYCIAFDVFASGVFEENSSISRLEIL